MPMQTHSYVVYAVAMHTKGVHKLFQTVFRLLQSLDKFTTVSLSKPHLHKVRELLLWLSGLDCIVHMAFDRGTSVCLAKHARTEFCRSFATL